MSPLETIAATVQRAPAPIAPRVRYRGAVRDDWLPVGGGHPIPIAPDSGEWLARLTWQFAGGDE